MFSTLLFGVVMFMLGFVYGRDETLWQKTIDFVKQFYKQIEKIYKK